MKRLILLALSLALFVGCATNRMRTLSATQDVIYGTKKAWVTYLKTEYARIDKLPATEQIPLRDALAARRARVHSLAAQADTLWWSAWTAAKYNQTAKPSAELLLIVADLKLATQP